MPDVFEIASMTDAIQGYLAAKKQRNVFEMEKKQREAEIMLNTMQEKRLRETMLQTGKFQQEELGEHKQQFQQSFGLQQQLFGEQQRATKAEEARLEKATESVVLLQDIQRRLGELEVKKGEELYTWQVGAEKEKARETMATAGGNVRTVKEYWSPEKVETRYIQSQAEKVEARLKGEQAEAGLELVAPQKEAMLAKADVDIASAKADAEYIRKTGKTEWIARADNYATELELQKERIALAKTDQEISREELAYKRMQLKYLQDNPPVSPERQFKFEQDKMKLGAQVDLLALLTRVKESSVPVGVSTELMNTQQQQSYYMSENMDPSFVNPMTNGAIGLGASYGITVTYKTVKTKKGKTYTVIDTFYKDGKPILPEKEGEVGTPTNPEIKKDDKNFDTQIRTLIDNIEKSIGMPTGEPTTDEIQKGRDKTLGGTGGTATTTKLPPLVTNNVKLIVDYIKASPIALSNEDIVDFGISIGASNDEIKQAINQDRNPPTPFTKGERGK